MKKMLNKEDIITKLKLELPYLKQEFRIKRIGLFGSFANETQSTDSDIDIIVEFEKPIGLKFMDLAEYLEKIFNRKVDLLTPDGIRSIRIDKVAQEINKSVIYV